jgi:hypothetical protein
MRGVKQQIGVLALLLGVSGVGSVAAQPPQAVTLRERVVYPKPPSTVITDALWKRFAKQHVD